MKRTALALLALAASACQPLDPVKTTADQEARGLALAQNSCSRCHAVGRYGDSPNPNAPPFAGIANREGVTRETLVWWLRDAHNYPNEMDFELNALDVAQLADHIMTLRDPNYRPPI